MLNPSSDVDAEDPTMEENSILQANAPIVDNSYNEAS